MNMINKPKKNKCLLDFWRQNKPPTLVDNDFINEGSESQDKNELAAVTVETNRITEELNNLVPHSDIAFKRNETHSWCLYEDNVRNSEGKIAERLGKGSSKHGYRLRWWYCESCHEYDNKILKLKPRELNLDQIGTIRLREYTQRQLIAHEKSSNHAFKHAEIQRKNAKNISDLNMLEESVLRDFNQKKNCICIAAFIGKNHLPLSCYSKMVEFSSNVQMVDLPKNSRGEVKWNSIGLGTGLIHAIAECLTKIQIEEVNKSNYWSISFDESTNIKKEAILIVYLRYLKNGTPTTEFFTIKDVGVSKTGIKIAHLVLECLNELRLDFSRCISFGTL